MQSLYSTCTWSTVNENTCVVLQNNDFLLVINNRFIKDSPL